MDTDNITQGLKRFYDQEDPANSPKKRRFSQDDLNAIHEIDDNEIFISDDLQVQDDQLSTPVIDLRKSIDDLSEMTSPLPKISPVSIIIKRNTNTKKILIDKCRRIPSSTWQKYIEDYIDSTVKTSQNSS